MLTIQRPNNTSYTLPTQKNSYLTKAERASQLISEAQSVFSSDLCSTQQKANVFIALIRLRTNSDLCSTLPIATRENLKLTISKLNRDGAFTHLNLNGSDLNRLYLLGLNLSGSNLNNANLSKANLFGANLSFATVDNANFSGTNTRHVQWEGVDLTGIVLKSTY